MGWFRGLGVRFVGLRIGVKMKHPVGYLLDTNIFNGIVKDTIALEQLPYGKYFCTRWQEDELAATKDEAKRAKLLDCFRSIAVGKSMKELEDRSTPWGSSWGSVWDRGGKFFPDIFKYLETAKPKDRGNWGDAINLEVCLYEGICFVTTDEAASKAAQNWNIEAIYFPTLVLTPP